MPRPRDDFDLLEPPFPLRFEQEIFGGRFGLCDVQPVKIENARLIAVLRLRNRLRGSCVSMFHEVAVPLARLYITFKIPENYKHIINRRIWIEKDEAHGRDALQHGDMRFGFISLNIVLNSSGASTTTGHIERESTSTSSHVVSTTIVAARKKRHNQ